jgi:hypothetical protein
MTWSIKRIGSLLCRMRFGEFNSMTGSLGEVRSFQEAIVTAREPGPPQKARELFSDSIGLFLSNNIATV